MANEPTNPNGEVSHDLVYFIDLPKTIKMGCFLPEPLLGLVRFGTFISRARNRKSD